LIRFHRRKVRTAVNERRAQVIKQDQLAVSNIAHELVGADHGGLGICVIFVDAPPGRGPDLYKHPYEEVFITLEGQATVVVDDEEIQAGPGDVVIVPANTPHSFKNTGGGRLRQIDIHVSPAFSTEWL
jgi:mannose-6-phosphate isomerase-like protein (cupin superfamily)